MENSEITSAPQPDHVKSRHRTPRNSFHSRPASTELLATISLSHTSQSNSATSSLAEELSQMSRDIEEEELELWPSFGRRLSLRHSVRSLIEARRSIGSTSSLVNLADELDQSAENKFPLLLHCGGRPRSNSAMSTTSDTSLQVDWESLDRNEAEEEEGMSDDEQTTLLLARLEMENNALVSNPKAAVRSRLSTQSRPPSVHQLKKMVQEQGAKSVRFSLVPEAAPMTELEFWAALVRDYTQTAQRLPTITSSKVRGGIPPPLRGVVWVSMAGARDIAIEERFDQLYNESSPYENTIAKDLGRSFPGVDMFKDPNGEGQRMLASVLKCYSLYDEKIGYCQGLGFLVGPLLMNMGDKQAFCILVRLMEDYDLRSCFQPNLSGLHLRIFQFKSLLGKHVPLVAQHLDNLGIEGTAYSQWFLSFFAVTCPLPLLFRIYDVVFAEGASETIMRVALAVIRRNEGKLLEFTELEDAMRLLLSRQLWDPYGCSVTSGDQLVHDFCDFTSVVTRESLSALESDFKKAQNGESTAKGFFPDVQSTASRFLGRLWAPSHGHTPSKASVFALPTLAPTTAASDVLHRTASKQSLATLASNDGGSDSSSSQSVSTAMTEMSRESTMDYASMKSPKSSSYSATGSSRLTMSSTKDKDLQNQIEDLLMACTELQREQNLLTAQLQREREERQEDHFVFQSLVEYLKDNFTEEEEFPPHDLDPPLEMDPIRVLMDNVTTLVNKVEIRLSPSNRRSSGYETKATLKASLATIKDQLHNETARSQDLMSQIREKDDEASRMRDELQQARSRVQAGHNERQRLEQTVFELRQAQRTGHFPASFGSQPNPDLNGSPGKLDASQTEVSTMNMGLREFRLMSMISNRSSNTAAGTLPSPAYAQRTSSLCAQTILDTANQASQDQDDLLLELVNAKTAEAMAKQELEEFKGRLEAMRRVLHVSPPLPQIQGERLTRSESRSSECSSSTTASKMSTGMPLEKVSSHGPSASVSWTGGGFFGWGKRNLSTSHAAIMTKK